MPSKRGLEQCKTWLFSKSQEGDTLDAINAEICLNVIDDMEKQVNKLGSILQNVIPAKKPIRFTEGEQIAMDFGGSENDA